MSAVGAGGVAAVGMLLIIIEVEVVDHTSKTVLYARA